MFTYRNGSARLGLFAQETALKLSNVRQESFGKLFDFSVDGFVYAQPLYMENVTIAGKGTRDVLFVTTEKDHVYAFDASGSSTAPLWHRALADAGAGVTAVPAADVKTHNTGPWVGITGTPAIDPESLTLYLVAATKENGRYVQRLHALDVQSGAEKFGGPVEIKASVPGKGNSNDGMGNVVFSSALAKPAAGAARNRWQGVHWLGIAPHQRRVACLAHVLRRPDAAADVRVCHHARCEPGRYLDVGKWSRKRR
ncbi:MAG: hypothetical protein L0Z53_02490 [Acidobacteriales bacterium]|nr:hypothetical protein [Terriglobales bacterium]